MEVTGTSTSNNNNSNDDDDNNIIMSNRNNKKSSSSVIPLPQCTRRNNTSIQDDNSNEDSTPYNNVSSDGKSNTIVKVVKVEEKDTHDQDCQDNDDDHGDDRQGTNEDKTILSSLLETHQKPSTTTNNKNHKRPNSLQQSYNQISNYLLNEYKINDNLDEDEVTSMITHMNNASKRRRRHRTWLKRDCNKGDTLRYDDYKDNPDDYWNDDDIYEQSLRDYNKLALDALVNIVDDTFFSNIIDGTEEHSAQILDENAVTTLRKCLAITGKSKVRKRRDILVAVHDDNDNDEDEDGMDSITESSDVIIGKSLVGDSSEGDDDNNNRRQTRRMLQKSLAKKTDDRDGGSMKGLDALIAAMLDIEESEGRSTSIEFDDVIHQGRRLRERNKGNSKETPKKRELSPSGSVDDNRVIDGKKKKRKALKTISPTRLSQQLDDSEDNEDGDLLYALLPARQDSRRRSARRSLDAMLVKISAIIVDGKNFHLPNDDGGVGDEQLDDTPRKRTYKKRRPYVKRGPYKKRKNNQDFVDIKMELGDIDQGLRGNKGQTRMRSKNIKSNETTEWDDILFTRESGPVSLSLLDWQRRQLLLRNKGRKKNEKPSSSASHLRAMTELISPGVNTRMNPWETLHSDAEQFAHQPPTLEPPRKRHTNDTYGCLCNTLINCLQGKARMFARHEFFYSDIDKAWFNENVFEIDLMKLGISSNTKLSRSAWSLVRKKIRKRPRLFSKRFIRSQMQQLERYRTIVRQIQKLGKGVSDYQTFNYDVLSPPKVGTTVSAYHRGARLIHRGTILARRNDYYLIQFERRELGWDWVQDTDVASHGVPDILLSRRSKGCSESSQHRHNIGSLPHGTSFGRLIDFYKKESQFTYKKSTPMKLLNSIQDFNDMSSKNQDIHNLVTEREALTKLMGIIDSTIERKQALLDAIEAFHGQLMDHSHALADEFVHHYDWLQENLNQTNDALESALMYQQIMYGQLYAGNSVANNTNSRNTTQKKMNSSRGKKWERTLQRCAMELGSEMIIRTLQDISFSPNNTLTDLFNSVASILITTDLISEMNNYGQSNDDVVQSLRRNISSLSHNSSDSLPKEMVNILQSRTCAFNDVEEALKMLQSELTMSTTK